MSGTSATVYRKEQREKANALLEKAGYDTKSTEKSLARKITDSDLYDWNSAARFLLTQLAVLAMDENSEYPADAPDEFHDDKEGWCWMSQHRLGLKIGKSESQTLRLLHRFVEDGVVVPRVWHDENMTPHSEYKVVEAVIDAHQRPSQKRGVERPKRYSKPRGANKGSFSTANQPGRSATQRAIMEEDDEWSH